MGTLRLCWPRGDTNLDGLLNIADAINFLACRFTGEASVFCECADGVVYLHGQVPSFYCKQLAQEALVGLPGVGQIVNEIEVTGGVL